jgi:superfamily I DNA/RNA helicase
MVGSMSAKPGGRLVPKADYPQVTGILTPSRYQEAVFDEVNQIERRHFWVNAVAGSGKTSTIVGAAKIIARAQRANLLFIAFNRHIVKELEPRLMGTKAKIQTCSSLGYETLRRAFPQTKYMVLEHKYREAWRKAIESSEFRYGRFLGLAFPEAVAARFLVMDKAAKAQFRDRLFRLRDLSISTGTENTPGSIERLASQFGIFCPPADTPTLSVFIELLNEFGEMEATRGRIDYGDMLWLPKLWNLTPPVYGNVFGDEGQDFNAVQLDLVRKQVIGGAKVVLVGDPYQSIYGWNGATPDALGKFETIADGARELKLSICYRCPKAVIALAKTIVPHIEAAPTASDGKVADTTTEVLMREARPGDLVLSRLGAPLLRTCFQFLAKGKAAIVRGSDVAKLLCDAVRAVGNMSGFRFERFPDFATEYGDRMLVLVSPDDDRRRDEIHDLVASMRECWRHLSSRGVDELCDAVVRLFGDDPKANAVCLSTVHKAKGLEADRVWIIEPDKLPLTTPRQTRQQFEEELRIKYVAITRARRELHFVF